MKDNRYNYGIVLSKTNKSSLGGKLSKKVLKKLKYLLVLAVVLVLVAVFSPNYLAAGDNSQVQAFVSRFYQQCLGRQPDQDGLNQWTSALLDGSKTGEDVAKGFVLSAEFTGANHDNATFITILYRAFFDREPDVQGYEIWLSRLNSGQSRESVLDGFLRSQEFTDLCAVYSIVPYSGASVPASTTAVGGGMISGTSSGFSSGNKVNFIVWGDDSASYRPGGRVSGRTDMNIFVHLNLDTRKAYVVPIPRDTWTPIPGRGSSKINGAHAMGGNDLAERTFEQFTGMPIDFYVITDFDGFPALIDHLGGVTTTVEENIADPFSNCYLNVGTHHLNGDQALALTRARKGRSAYGGGAYAREWQASMLLVDLFEQKKAVLGDPGGFLNTMQNFVWSNISVAQAARIFPVLMSMSRNDIVITKFDSWPQWFGSASAVGYNEAAKNQFFNNISNM